jgi:hypothetical protein
VLRCPVQPTGRRCGTVGFQQSVLWNHGRGRFVRRLLRIASEAGGDQERRRVLRLTVSPGPARPSVRSGLATVTDPTRVQLVELLARTRTPISVGDIVTAMGLAQSTVSQHLKVLADVRFVLVEAVGNARHYRINDACVACFPSAADLVMGKPAPTTPGLT